MIECVEFQVSIRAAINLPRCLFHPSPFNNNFILLHEIIVRTRISNSAIYGNEPSSSSCSIIKLNGTSSSSSCVCVFSIFLLSVSSCLTEQTALNCVQNRSSAQSQWKRHRNTGITPNSFHPKSFTGSQLP